MLDRSRRWLFIFSRYFLNLLAKLSIGNQPPLFWPVFSTGTVILHGAAAAILLPVVAPISLAGPSTNRRQQRRRPTSGRRVAHEVIQGVSNAVPETNRTPPRRHRRADRRAGQPCRVPTTRTAGCVPGQAAHELLETFIRHVPPLRATALALRTVGARTTATS